MAGRALLDVGDESRLRRARQGTLPGRGKGEEGHRLMPSTSHRRCQYQGEGCMGTAHAGHDQCAHCYFTYIKPQIAAERLEVKRRRALKRPHGVLDGDPQQEGGTLGYLNLEKKGPTPPPRPGAAIRDAIYDLELDKLITGKTDEQALEAVSNELFKTTLG